MLGHRYRTAAAAAALVLAPGAAWAQAVGGSWRFGCGPHMMGWAGMVFMPLFMVLVLAAVIAVAVLLVRGFAGAPRMPPGATGLDILNERFARGEIDKQEFDERRRVLRS